MAAPQAAQPAPNDTPLQLVFHAQTDWAFPTDFTIDTIRFLTSCQ